MSDFREHLDKELENPEFKREFERTQPDYECVRALVAARIEQGLTQKELAERCGIKQSNISRIENGTSSPNLTTLHALAEGMGKKLRVEFI